MTAEDAARWDRRYADGSYAPRDVPSPFVERWLPTVMAAHGGAVRALDVATGTGRNARLLARSGCDVTAMDVSRVALQQAEQHAADEGLTVRWVHADLDDADLGGPYDLITVARFRDERLWPRLVGALAPDGWVLVEHHLLTPLDVGGPPDDFRVRPGELLAAFAGLRIVQYEEVLEPADLAALDGQRFVNVRIAAVAGDPGY